MQFVFALVQAIMLVIHWFDKSLQSASVSNTMYIALQPPFAQHIFT